MTRSLLTLASLALLAGCGYAGPGAASSARAIGCVPGACPTARPTPAPCGGFKPRPLAIGCLPGDCPPKPRPTPCR